MNLFSFGLNVSAAEGRRLTGKPLPTRDIDHGDEVQRAADRIKEQSEMVRKQQEGK